jgi:hypothetical protein
MTRKNRRRQHNSSPRPSPYDTADRRRLPYNERRILNENRRVLDDNRLVLDDDRRSGQREDEHPPGHRIDSKSRRRRNRGPRNGPPWPPKVNASTDRYTLQYQQENSRSLPKTPGTNGTTPSVQLPAAIRERNAALPQREPSRPDAPAAVAAYAAAYGAAAPVSGGASCPRAGPGSTAHTRTGPDSGPESKPNASPRCLSDADSETSTTSLDRPLLFLIQPRSRAVPEHEPISMAHWVYLVELLLIRSFAHPNS